MEETLHIEQTVRKERNRLLAFIRKRVRTAEDAEDILQDVFVQLAAGYSVTEAIEELTAWLFTVARNKIIDWYRRRKPESFPFDEDEPGGIGSPTGLLHDTGELPDGAYARSLFWAEFEEAIEELPEEQREVFVRHELEGWSFKEMAEDTGVPLNTLLSRKRYAVLFLRERLREFYEGLETT